MNNPAPLLPDLTDLDALRQLGLYLFTSEPVRQDWAEAMALIWPRLQTHNNPVRTIGQLLLQTRAYSGVTQNWSVIGRSDAAAAVCFIEACARRVLPEGIRWSVLQPQEVLDVETLFIEANQQLRVFGQQFYQLQVDEGVLMPVLVMDAVGFTALARRLGLTYSCFDVGLPRHSENHHGKGVRQILFWALYMVLVLWGVYHLAVWVLSWMWHWFD